MRFQILGPLSVRTEPSAAEADLGGIKQQAVLLALLLAKGQVVSNDRLIDAVWGDRPPTKPNVTLRSYISHLRRVLEPDRGSGERPRRIVTRAPGYAMVVQPEEVDAWQFELDVEAATHRFNHGDLEDALALIEVALGRWRVNDLTEGPLALFDLDVARLRELRRMARRLRHDTLLQLGRHGVAIPSLEMAVADDPYDEGTRAQLMVALYRHGRQSDALACFEQGRRLLREELGLDPSTELRALEQRILHNDPGLDWASPVPRSDPAVPITPVDPEAPLGRHTEARAIAGCLEQARDEAVGSMIVLTGEPGIGKSTLVQHAAELARARGFAVAVGRCHDGANDTTLLPWVTAWRDLIDRLDETELGGVVADNAAALAQVLPEIGTRLGVTPSSTPDRFSLFDIVVRAVQRGAALDPVCIVLEDLHWADENTLRLLAVFAESLVGHRLVIIASWRDTEVTPTGVATLLGGIITKSNGRHWRLGGLGTEAVAELVARTGDRASGGAERGVHSDIQAEAATLVARTGGNPLFINEVLRSRGDGSGLTASDTVREAILGRLRRLPAGTAESLTVGALCLEGFSETIVARVRDEDEDAVLDQLEAALAARLIEEDPDNSDRFRFVHDLFAETLVASLSSPRRARLNTRLGEALERERTAPAVLAHHYLRGSGRMAAIKGAEYAYTAAAAAASLFDYGGATRLLEAAVEALGDGDDAEPLLADLLLDLTQVSKHTRQPPVVHQLAQRAYEVAARLGDARRMALAAIRFSGTSQTMPGDGDQTWLGYWSPAGVIIPMLEAGVAKLADDDPLLTVLYTKLGGQYFGPYEDDAAADEAFALAIAAARRSGYDQEISFALRARHSALQRVLSLDERQALLDEALATTDADRHPVQTVALYRSRAMLALDRADLAAAQEELAQARRAALASELPLALMNTEVGEIGLELFQGHYGRAEVRLGAAFAAYERFGDAMLDQFGLQLASLWREQRRQRDVLNLLAVKLEGYPGPAFSAPLAVIQAELGDLDAAAATISRFTPEEQTRGGEGELQFLTTSFFAEAAALLGDAALAERLWAPLSLARGRIVAVYDGIVILGAGSYYLGRLATVLGRYDEATELLAEALEHHRRLDAHGPNLRVALAQADVARARGDDAGVADALAAAERWSQRGGLRWRLDDWRQTNGV